MQGARAEVDALNRYHQRMDYEWDAVVIGAGIIGLAVGRELARRGKRTAIIEERTIASGATQASAGVLAPHIEAPGEGALHDLTVRSLSLYDRFIADLQQEAGTAVEYRREGSLEIASCPASGERLRAAASTLAAAGVEAEWIDGLEAVRREPALATPDGALMVATHGYVRVSQLTAALEAAARRYGATVLEGRRVAGVDPRPHGGVTVRVEGGRHHASTVVVSAGSWSTQVVPGAAPVTPIRGQLLQLQWNGAPITRVLWSEFCYVVPWVDGTILVGATVENAGFDQRTTVAGVRGLIEAACRVMPQAAEATFVAARAGLRPSTADGVPLIGRAPFDRSIVYATGHYRNGVLLAPLTAQIVADLVIDDRHDRALAKTAPGR
jgi:glycine oxidase